MIPCLSSQLLSLRSSAGAYQKSLNPLAGIAVIVRAGAVEWGGGDPAPFVLPECEALAAQQRPPFVSAEREALAAQRRCRDG
jgi:hypothetical protein